MSLGFSYAPGSDIQMNAGASPSKQSPQQAVKVMSLRVPQALPSNAPVNRSLLTSPGGSAPGAGGLQSLIQQLIQSFKPQAGTAGPMAGPPTAGPAIAGGPTPMAQPMAPQSSPVGIPPRVNPSGDGNEQPAPGMQTPSAPAPFQSFENAPSYSPSPMIAPHITWGDDWMGGPSAPANLGQNPDEIEAWNQMMNLGPSGGLQQWLQQQGFGR